ncbi:MAG TPA: penicillin acylase family protein, partial [Balneolales bacterium]|nr:penicillin acylase family protein [Balneolales bacterium]
MKQNTVNKFGISIRSCIMIAVISFGTIIGGIQYSKAQVPHIHSYGKATVYLDHYGVPHIYGPTDASVIYASAWVEANANWKLVEQNFLRSIG